MMGSRCDYCDPNNNPQYLLTKRQSRLTQWIHSEKEVLPYPPYRDTLSPCPSLLSADPPDHPEHPVHLEPDPDTSSQRKRGDRATLCPAGGAEFLVCSSLPLSLLGEERSCCRCLFRVPLPAARAASCLCLPRMLLPSKHSTSTAQNYVSRRADTVRCCTGNLVRPVRDPRKPCLALLLFGVVETAPAWAAGPGVWESSRRPSQFPGDGRLDWPAGGREPCSSHALLTLASRIHAGFTLFPRPPGSSWAIGRWQIHIRTWYGTFLTTYSTT
jgi:hypothetical protein